MKPPPFEYLAPESLEAGLESLGEHGDDAKLLAGGQSLVPAMNFRLLQPSVLVDLNNVMELDFIERADSGLRIGAMTRQRKLEQELLIAERAPLLHETTPFIAHPQIRNRGTLGGSLAYADPAAELPVVALALDARFYIQSATSDRWVEAADFFQGMFTTALAADEILVEVEIPAMPHRTGWSFVEFARRQGDYALVGVAALVTLDEEGTCKDACLVYLNVGDGPVDARQAAQTLLGEKHSTESIEAAAETAAEKEIEPMGSVHASIPYQRHLARVLTNRALNQAFERAAKTMNNE